VGLTTTEASQWWTLKLGMDSNDRDINVIMPGHLSVMEKLDEELIQSIGRWSNTIIAAFERDAFGSEGENRPAFFPKDKKRELLQLFLTNKFRLPDNERVRAEGVSIVFGNGMTPIHYDTKNDFREGHSWVLTASATFDAAIEEGWFRKDLSKLVKAEINIHALSVMLIFYTRHIVGSKGDEIEKKSKILMKP
jgi:hypothetical protein